MNARERMLQEFESHKGELVINHFKIVQFIGIGEDEMDLYYIINDGKQITWVTGVDWIEPLKGKIGEWCYNNMVRIAKLNYGSSFDLFRTGKEPQKQELIDFTNKYREESLNNYTKHESHKILTDICWDIV